LVKFLVRKFADQENRNDCCIEAAKSAAEHDHLKVVKFLVPQFLAHTVADHTNGDQCCIDAAKSATIKGHLELVKLLISCLLSADQRADLRFQFAVAACSRLREDVVASLGLEPHGLFQCSIILSFTAAMVIEGRNSVLNDTLSRMQPAHITQLLRLSISLRYVALAVTLINDERVSTEHVDLPDSTGATALMLAADAGHHELIEKLIDLGASVRAEDSQGRTALSRACEAGHVRAAKSLMDKGADASHRDGRGLTCAQVAQRFEQRQVLRLLDLSGAESPEARQAATHRLDSGLYRLPDDSQQDRRLSEELHRLLSDAGFTEQRAKCQQRLTDWLERVARVLTQDGRQMTGSYAEGWANSLVQEFHLEGGCDGQKSWRDSCKDATRLQVTEGHAKVAIGAVPNQSIFFIRRKASLRSLRSAGGQPAVAAMECGVRPAQDTCQAIQCCSSFGRDEVKKLPCTGLVHLVRVTRPSSTNELRVSFSFQEKDIMRWLSTVQGQLFTLIKFIFKRHLPLTLDTPGLKTYHAKTLLFFMLEKHGTHPKNEAWQPHNLIALLKESLDMMLSFIDSSSSPDECMPHFFMPKAPLYFKNAGIGSNFDNTKARVRDRLCELRSDIGGVVQQLRRLVRPLQSEKFYFHPFTLLPLTAPLAVTEIREGSSIVLMLNCYFRFADVYSVVHQCVHSGDISDSHPAGVPDEGAAAVEQRAVGEAVNALAAPFTPTSSGMLSRPGMAVWKPLLMLRAGSRLSTLPRSIAIRAHGLTSESIAGWTTPGQQVEDDLPRSDVGGKIVLLEGVFPLRGETHVQGLAGSAFHRNLLEGPDTVLRRGSGRAGVPGDGHKVCQRELKLGLVFEGEDDAAVGVSNRLDFDIEGVVFPEEVINYANRCFHLGGGQRTASRAHADFKFRLRRHFGVRAGIGLLWPLGVQRGVSTLVWLLPFPLRASRGFIIAPATGDDLEAVILRRPCIGGGSGRTWASATKLPEDSDWAWRFCLPCDSPPRFPFLPEFTQTLFTARLSQPLSSHLYVNFRCLSWSLQAELLRNRAPAIAFDHWIEQLLEDPDLEELLTLAHYSDCREHVELSLQQMEMIEKERRVVMETQDEAKIGWVRQKRWRVSNRSGSDSGAHRSREDEKRRLSARARLRRDGADLGPLVAMETAAEQRDSWTHAKLSRMRLRTAWGGRCSRSPLRCHAGCTEAKAADSALMLGREVSAAQAGGGRPRQMLQKGGQLRDEAVKSFWQPAAQTFKTPAALTAAVTDICHSDSSRD
uniref:ANK_REP_REGION domain-containing protein n=1 Tax=Macrostomum lignano TaxID=282301 RepID=A0A1I8GN21_9PLAT